MPALRTAALTAAAAVAARRATGRAAELPAGAQAAHATGPASTAPCRRSLLQGSASFSVLQAVRVYSGQGGRTVAGQRQVPPRPHVACSSPASRPPVVRPSPCLPNSSLCCSPVPAVHVAASLAQVGNLPPALHNNEQRQGSAPLVLQEACWLQHNVLCGWLLSTCRRINQPMLVPLLVQPDMGLQPPVLQPQPARLAWNRPRPTLPARIIELAKVC